MFAVTATVTLSTLLLAYVQAADITTTCPSDGYQNGKPSNVTCLVDRTSVDAKCAGLVDLVFYFTPSNGARGPWCTTKYQTCENSGQSLPACNGCSCRCDSPATSSGIQEYSLTFQADINSHDGSTITCDATCLTAPTLDDSTCQGLNIVSPQTCTNAGNCSDAGEATMEADGNCNCDCNFCQLGDNCNDDYAGLCIFCITLPFVILGSVSCCIFVRPGQGNVGCYWCCMKGKCFCVCVKPNDGPGPQPGAQLLCCCTNPNIEETHECYFCRKTNSGFILIGSNESATPPTTELTASSSNANTNGGTSSNASTHGLTSSNATTNGGNSSNASTHGLTSSNANTNGGTSARPKSDKAHQATGTGSSNANTNGGTSAGPKSDKAHQATGTG